MRVRAMYVCVVNFFPSYLDAQSAKTVRESSRLLPTAPRVAQQQHMRVNLMRTSVRRGHITCIYTYGVHFVCVYLFVCGIDLANCKNKYKIKSLSDLYGANTVKRITRLASRANQRRIDDDSAAAQIVAWRKARAFSMRVFIAIRRTSAHIGGTTHSVNSGQISDSLCAIIR